LQVCSSEKFRCHSAAEKERNKMSWTKKEAPAPEAPALIGLAQPAPAAQSAPEPEAAWKKIPTPAALLMPEAQAYTNNLISEAVRGVFERLGPILQSIALTPEKLAEAEALRRAPDPALVAREMRERRLMQQEQEENRANLMRNQTNCPHKYPTGQWAVCPVRNYPDRRERFICNLCQSFFQPKRWEIGAPDAENPRGRAYIAEEHPQYRLVREVLAQKG
jgi:hypothetical protein